MNVYLSRLAIFLFISTPTLGSRPDVHEDRSFHILTSGHSIKSSAFVARQKQRRHRASQHKLLDQQEFEEHALDQAMEHEASLLQDHELLREEAHHEHGIELAREEHQLLKLEWERAKREFYRDAASSHQQGADAKDIDYTTSASALYWIFRILFMATAICILVRHSLIPKMQQASISAAMQWRKELGVLSDVPKEGPREVAEASPRVDQLCDVQGEREQTSPRTSTAPQPVKKELCEAPSDDVSDKAKGAEAIVEQPSPETVSLEGP